MEDSSEGGTRKEYEGTSSQYYYHHKYGQNYHTVPGMASMQHGATVYANAGPYQIHPHMYYVNCVPYPPWYASEYQGSLQEDHNASHAPSAIAIGGNQGKGKRSSKRRQTRSSKAIIGAPNLLRSEKSAISSIIGLSIPDKEFQLREQEFQMPLHESLSMEAAHYKFISSEIYEKSSEDISIAALNGDVRKLDPDVVRQLAFHQDGSKALQRMILSHVKVHELSEICRAYQGTEPTPPRDELQQFINQMYDALSKDIVNLCLDMYGNYTVQCLLMHASPTVVASLGDMIVSHVVPLSLDFYGCRVVQRAMEHLPMEYRSKMCDALEPLALHCLQSQNANHVIDGLLALPWRDRPDHAVQIHASICRHAPVLATHKYGVTVLKTALESDIAKNVSKEATQRLLQILGDLIYDEFGNYLIQSLIQSNLYGTRHAVHEFLLHCPLLTLSCDKFGSNVFETSLLNSTQKQIDAVITTFLQQCQAAGQIDEVVANVSIDRYGNYIVQKMLAMSSFRLRQLLFSHLAPHSAMLIESKHGRHTAKQLLGM
ncbi:hypothetical protein M9434_002725 [Picochlorum sp. BPE23]|nr:hypothetical protein M9434_002725 [Picochlorum sp. BPE23]